MPLPRTVAAGGLSVMARLTIAGHGPSLAAALEKIAGVS
jgi:hypothetical protein